MNPKSLVRKIRGKIKKKRTPKGHWAIVEYSESASEKCTNRPMIIRYMFGDRVIGEEIFDDSLIQTLPEIPIVFRQIHPCFKDMRRQIFFGYMEFKRRVRL